MIECWRWYGEYDLISLSEIAQTGARGIVSALHNIPYGEVWPNDQIQARNDQFKSAGFHWAVVESLPVHERIKRGDGDLSTLFSNYRQSIVNLADHGVKTICYNFMPLLDWTRTDLTAPVLGGGTCLRFDAVKMAAFEIHMLARKNAEADYDESVVIAAKHWFDRSSQSDQDELLDAIMAGMPGAFDRYDVAGLNDALAQYQGIDRNVLRQNYKRFLDEVVPTAAENGVKLCVHPDDPPRDILGLPRIVSTAEDLEWIMKAHDNPANGVTLCSGSLGANPQNNIPKIAANVADRIHFAHLRNVRSEPNGSFEEAPHLDGDTDMIALIKVLLDEQSRRREMGRSDYQIPFRPDHGHHILSDADREYIPGYPLVGRLRGLAELRGVMRALSHV
ncbi:mannonate dehydratase [Amylibacter kogurei]|uniref:Mannonate dehydratase n=1 Tax=Paramylibacter kogurei TaxID=1889778 RepID=A0A2G5K7B9_9RHOB|nr:mannonate dehydratase [Amylibacter kogurei]PIB24750.1 mannonate dehydratase [Amylibacter kogurei]